MLQQLLALKTNKAIGLDKISARLLKNSAHTIALSVTKLLNLSNKTGKFPKLRKCFKIEPCLTQGTGQMHQTTVRKTVWISEGTVHFICCDILC